MDTPTIAVIVTVTLAWSGFLIGIIKWLLDRNLELFKQQIASLSDEMKKLKDDFASFRAELPVKYVRVENCVNCRNEWLRSTNIIGQKLDLVWEKVSEKLDDLRKEFYAERNR